MTEDSCIVALCDGDPWGPRAARGFCARHYQIMRRQGYLSGDRRRPLKPPHGTYARYRSKVWACRCPECRAAASRERQKYPNPAKHRPVA